MKAKSLEIEAYSIAETTRKLGYKSSKTVKTKLSNRENGKDANKDKDDMINYKYIDGKVRLNGYYDFFH